LGVWRQKTVRKDAQKYAHVTLARFATGFSLILGLVATPRDIENITVCARKPAPHCAIEMNRQKSTIAMLREAISSVENFSLVSLTDREMIKIVISVPRPRRRI
jgi:formate dehydrogenase assembly factor FdhD